MVLFCTQKIHFEFEQRKFTYGENQSLKSHLFGFTKMLLSQKGIVMSLQPKLNRTIIHNSLILRDSRTSRIVELKPKIIEFHQLNATANNKQNPETTDKVY